MPTEENRDLSQLIIINGSFSDKIELQRAIAKAPILLVTRCFKNMPDFIGAYESTQYEKDILDWVNQDQKLKIVVTDDADAVEGYMFVTEMNGSPSKLIKHNGEVVLLVTGPFDTETLNEMSEGLEEYAG
jgi:hypothetical protein